MHNKFPIKVLTPPVRRILEITLKLLVDDTSVLTSSDVNSQAKSLSLRFLLEICAL